MNSQTVYTAAMTKGRISDDAVQRATGKVWKEWFRILDSAGARKMSHYDIAQFLSTTHIKNGWWAQMVTVEYERAMGLRKVNQNAAGFLVAVHKTVGKSLAVLEKEWQKLISSKTVASRKLVPLPSKTKRPARARRAGGRMLRYKADIGGVVVSFDSRGSNKSRIMIESVKLPSRAAVDREREFWKGVLSTIK